MRRHPYAVIPAPPGLERCFPLQPRFNGIIACVRPLGCSFVTAVSSGGHVAHFQKAKLDVMGHDDSISSLWNFAEHIKDQPDFLLPVLDSKKSG